MRIRARVVLLTLIVPLFALYCYIFATVNTLAHLGTPSADTLIEKVLWNASLPQNRRRVHSSRTRTTKEQIRGEESYPFTFSACLLMKDDNKILPEWLAYHYTTLPLRHLVLAIDPWSVTKSDHIVNDWREMGMRIDVWHDEDYMEYTNKKTQKVVAEDSMELKYRSYDGRQLKFIHKCLEHLHQQNRTWTMLVDSDEYLLYNTFQMRVGSWGDFDPCTQMSYESACADRSRLPASPNVTMAEFMHREKLLGETTLLGDKKHYCLYFPRVLFGGWESTHEEVYSQAPSGFNATLFDTLRFRKHSLLGGHIKSGKSIVDASRYNRPRVINPHNVLPRFCDQNNPPHMEKSIFRIHHYTGSLEAYMSRPGDLRRTETAYALRNQEKGKLLTNDEARFWLKEFVSKVGIEKAKQLTQDRKEGAFLDDARVNEQIAQAEVVNRRKFLNYTSSPWEQVWLDNIAQWQSDTTGFCRRLGEQKEQLDVFVKSTCSSIIRLEDGEQYCVLDWSSSRFYYNLSPALDLSQAMSKRLAPSAADALSTTKDLSYRFTNDSSSVLSEFIFEDEKTGERYTEYIEPLVGDLRHPLEACLQSSEMDGESISSSSLPNGDRGINLRSPLTARRPTRFPNASGSFYFNLGATHWNQSDAFPSLSTVADVWKRNGIEMDKIYVWASGDADAFRESLPDAIQDRAKYFEQEKISTERRYDLKGYDDPKHTFVPMMMREMRKRDDYILFHLQSGPGFNDTQQGEILDHLLDGWNNYVEWIDELIWTLPRTFDDLSKGYDYLLKLRQRGVRTHSYV